MESKTRLRAALDSLFVNQKPIPTTGGQMCGAEMWQLRFSGFMQGEVYDALEATEREQAEARAEIERKDKLIEQMYEAIKFSLIADEVRQTRNVCASDINDACKTSRIKRIAALSAAERGE